MSVTEVKVPKLGLTIESVEIGTWLVQPGDHVRAGDALVELNADKADFVMESPATGTVAELLAEEGDEVLLTTVIARITDDSVDPPDIIDPPVAIVPPVAAASLAPPPSRAIVSAHIGSPGGAPPAIAAPGRVQSSPYARRLATESEINIAALTGTGPGGRVVARDINDEQQRLQTSASSVAHSVTPAVPGVDIITSSTWQLTLPIPYFDRTALYLACAYAAADSLGFSRTGQMRIVRHKQEASHHSVLSDWRDLTPEGLLRRLGGAPTDPASPVDLIVHDLDALGLYTWTPALDSTRTIILGATTPTVSLTSGAQPSLRQVHLVPVTLVLPGQVNAQPIAAFCAALTTYVHRA